MASKRKLRRRACDGKKRFSQEGAAIARKYIIKTHGDKISYYKCKFCKSYHLGHSSKRKLQSVLAKIRALRK